ncbi:methylated-DNA--[protein]-cysteine S-methyltransferase [Paenibacillus cymbidii]|uniref:methylated-DNA--[protein]-cysteine S-methyltransferase n=1 Tax=Paenibacillus cymbidii TaxID=1639034 RepID=UPI0010815F6C|nr:methylated-DNA--[protein]-cysteine S-methyltransferase [Paenibacillus cymbidii]
MTRIGYAEIESPIGPLTLCATAAGLCHIEFGSWRDMADKLAGWAGKMYDAPAFEQDPALLAETAEQLRAYFVGRLQRFELALDLRGTPFQVRVWQALYAIPFGETRSYLQIGEAIGSPKAVRAVGGANNRNPVPIVVPCHRVIGKDGTMVGYGGGVGIKRHLLQLEGVQARFGE